VRNNSIAKCGSSPFPDDAKVICCFLENAISSVKFLAGKLGLITSNSGVLATVVIPARSLKTSNGSLA
jgi:hypothetical protein